ncbi:hypothetical protein [Streptomyces purpurascens]|uniref:Uncharacterized protein n=1 Tax=Streptomyces purpurascens TaxID=1924 RepID=A0ABZ1MG68_STREF
MSQQYPQQPYPPQQPGVGAPAPQPPKKRSAGKIAGLGCAGIIALFVIVAVATGGGSSESKHTSNKDRAVAADGKPGGGGDSGAEPADEKSQAEQFRNCVAKNGTDTEKAAVEHVTKVTGADKLLTYLGLTEDIAPDAVYEITYEIRGGESGPVIETAQLSDRTSLNFTPTVISTPSAGSKVSVEITDVLTQGP